MVYLLSFLALLCSGLAETTVSADCDKGSSVCQSTGSKALLQQKLKVGKHREAPGDDAPLEEPDEISPEHPPELRQMEAGRSTNAAFEMKKERLQAVMKSVKDGKRDSVDIREVQSMLVDLMGKNEDFGKLLNSIDANGDGKFDGSELRKRFDKNATYKGIVEKDHPDDMPAPEPVLAETKQTSGRASWVYYGSEDVLKYQDDNRHYYFLPRIEVPEDVSSPEACYIFTYIFNSYGCFGYFYTNTDPSDYIPGYDRMCRCLPYSAWNDAEQKWDMTWLYSSMGNNVYYYRWA